MNEAKLLFRAYYEALHELLEAKKDLLAVTIEKLLQQEVAKRAFGSFDEEKYAAYRDACLAFVDERTETYNPIGIQYTFGRTRTKEAFELQLQLDWYDSRPEFEDLTEAVLAMAQMPMTDEKMCRLADELIKKLGAYPDRSIISAYEARPALGKLPDYIVARAIEEVIR
ncbi:MAG: hypothetical protein ACYS30_04660 [Planctomycetota bacterium]|jgi:hypothetical protein